MGQRHDKALRLIAGALVGSDLTERELVSISERLMFDPSWTRRLAMFLKEVARASDAFRRDSIMKLGFSESEMSDEDIADELTELFSRKRLTKAQAFRVLKKASKSKEWEPHPGRTLRENCISIVQLQPNPEEARSLVNRVAELLGYASDPYLRELA